MSLCSQTSSVFYDIKNAAHRLPEEIRSLVLSDDFESAVRHADANPDTQAFLLIKALDGISLDPLQGIKASDFYSERNGVISFVIRFDRTVNFISPIVSLPANSGRVQQIIDAINKNIGSKMFKAAKMSRRLDRCFAKLEGQAAASARKAYMTVFDSGTKDRTQALYDAANDAYEKVYRPRYNQLNERRRNVSRAACPSFQGSYTEDVARFLYHHLPIQ